VSMRSIGLASSSSCRKAHLQNDATAARLRLRVDPGLPDDLARQGPDRCPGQPCRCRPRDGRQPDHVAAVGADRVRQLGGVGQVCEEVVEVAA
jgi:hypothetical protein